MRRWRGAAAVVVAASLAALTACGAPGPADAPDGRSDGARARAQALLDRQAAAVLDGDPEAYLATVDPRAGRYRDAQRTVFRNLALLPLDQWSYRVTGTGRDAFPPARRGDPRRMAVRAELRYRIGGYDTAPVRAVEHLTLTERRGRWYVSSDGDGGTRQLWEQGRMTVVRGERSLVLGTGRNEGALRALAADADRAVPAVAGAWPLDWSRRVLVHVPASPGRMAELLGGAPSSYRGIAAVTTGEADGDEDAPAERIVVNPRAYRLLSEYGRKVVMRHETAHVATRAHTTGATPTWLSEGFADWVGHRGAGRTPPRIAPALTTAVREGRPPRRLPPDAAFDFAADGGRLSEAYESGWLACRMVARHWGEAELVELYLAAGRGGKAADGGGERWEAALREVLGVGPREFTARWRTYVHRELGGR